MTGIVPGKDFMKSLEEATIRYAESLHGSAGEDYLAARGITPLAMDYFRLGYVGNPAPEHAEYEGMISIPYIGRGGIATVRFRRISGVGPKYMSLPGMPGKARPFNVRAFQDPRQTIYVCEGEIDAITACQCRLNAVGFAGANTWKSEYWRMFRYRHVVILADNDDTGAGMAFANTVSGDLRDSRVIPMPKGYDVNSFFLSKGEDGFREYIGA